MKMNKFLINLILIIAICILQVSLFSIWRHPLNNLNLVLVLIIFVTVIVDYRRGLWWAFGAGLFLELFSNLNFGIITISLLTTTIILNLLFNVLFTNRSLYSLLILAFLGNLSYNLIITLGELLKFNLSTLITLKYLYQISWGVILNLTTLTIIFLVFNFLTKKLKSVFLTNH